MARSNRQSMPAFSNPAAGVCREPRGAVHGDCATGTHMHVPPVACQSMASHPAMHSSMPLPPLSAATIPYSCLCLATGYTHTPLTAHRPGCPARPAGQRAQGLLPLLGAGHARWGQRCYQLAVCAAHDGSWLAVGAAADVTTIAPRSCDARMVACRE